MFNFFKKKQQPGSLPKSLPFSVDIHSHILPGIDDGATDMETSLELIQGLYDLGIRKCIATPHIIGDLYRNTPEIINAALEKTAIFCSRAGIDMELSAAAEYMLDDYFMDLLKKKTPLLTLHKNIILTEISYSSSPQNLDEIAAAIIDAGYTPILAHPERYNYYQQNFEDYYRLKKMGFFLQVNLLSLTGYYGKKAEKAAKFLIQKNLVSFVGTDLHHHKHLDAISNNKNIEVFKYYLDANGFNYLDAITK
jgi:protein-tyrosine phosphatase